MTSEKRSDWTQPISPFHEGEQAIQERLAVRDKMERIGRRFIREYMPEQHRHFYTQLPFLVLGSVDASGRPWASIVAGEPGFITSPDEFTLTVQTRPFPHDPLNENLIEGADVGMLGIELESRRRNRMNGTLKAVGTDRWTIAVNQSFGNCPQYIQQRHLHWRPERLATAPSAPVPCLTHLDRPLRDLITAADTLFIATRYSTSQTSANHGVDVSHRGGKPGFVRVDNDRTITFPDFAGNNFFNTLGNILLDGRVGLLFLDFQAGHLLSLTGTAKIIWEGEELQRFIGAERLVQITIDEMVYLPSVLPFQWDLENYSPALEFTGRWT